MDRANANNPMIVDCSDSGGAHEEVHSQVQSTVSTGKTSSKRKSDIWNEYDIYQDENGKDRAKCKFCPKNFAVGSNTHGTSNLRRHVEGIGKCLGHSNQDVNHMHISHETLLRSKKISQEVYREKVSFAIMRHNYPFLMVEHEGTREIHSYLNPDVKHISRNTAKADCLKLYKREKEKLKQQLENVPGRICLTTDVWQSCTTEGYISLTAHFVDDKWNLHSRVLNFSHFPPPHSGVFLADKMFNFLKEWGIEKKIFSITVDNASANDNMQDILKRQLRMIDGLLCDGEFFHIRCSAHILNLIVQDGLKIVNVAIHKIRESVKYVKGSESRLLKFVECCEYVGVKYLMGLRMDVPTRWNATFLMLECAIRYRLVFERYALVEPGYKYCPTTDEWDRGEKICKLLAPFNEITTLVSGSEYPTANLYFKSVWKIHLRLLEEQESEDEVICSMAKQMLPKFLKYWDTYCVVLAIASVLDPRYKMNVVEFCYKKIAFSNLTEKVAAVKQALTALFQEYITKYSVITLEQSPARTSGDMRIEDDFSVSKQFI